jgi:thermostable 8-oxoguanine DNA glycosylase
MSYDFDLEYWIKKYEIAYPTDAAGHYPRYIDEKGVEREEKSPYFENMSKVLANRGFLHKTEFVSICRWKAHRQIKNYKLNNEQTIRQITKQLLKEEDDAKKIKLLLCGELKGVQIPVASAILTVIHPDKFCITDYRAWRSLWWWKTASEDGKLTLSSYKKYADYLDNLKVYSGLEKYLWYLRVMRSIAKEANKTPRQIEMALWKFDKMKGIRN